MVAARILDTAVEAAKSHDGYSIQVAARSLRNGCLISALQKGPPQMKALAAILIVFGVGIVIWGAFGFTTRERLSI
jgi:hypothetical protein